MKANPADPGSSCNVSALTTCIFGVSPSSFLYMTRLAFTVLSISLLTLQTFGAIAQERRAQIIQAKVASGSGSVLSEDDEIHYGEVTFNDNLGVVTIVANGESRSFNARNTQRFEFDDAQLERNRTFHVFDYLNEDTGMTNPAFFEVLAEFETFAVLSKIDPVQARPQRGLTPPIASTLTSADSKKVAFQNETVFIMNDKGAMLPYLKLTEKEIEGVYFDTRSNKKKYLDKNVIEDYAGAHYPALESYAVKNDLSFKNKEDLIKILDHYKVLISK